MTFLIRVLATIRAVFGAIFLVVYTAIYASIFIVLVGTTGNQEIADFIMRTWAQALLFVHGIRLRVEGEENLRHRGAIYVFNHSSNIDVMMIAARLPKHGRFGAKIELYKIPIFGHALKAGKLLPIRRAERDRVLQMYEESIPRLREGTSFILAGEGTRYTGVGVGPKFKSGPFVFAISAQVPIVPIVVRGAAECQPRGAWFACADKWRHNVVLKALPPIPTTGLTQDDRQRLQDETRALMAAEYDKIVIG